MCIPISTEIQSSFKFNIKQLKKFCFDITIEFCARAFSNFTIHGRTNPKTRTTIILKYN